VTFERVIDVDATPQVVFDVLSRAEYVREWWPGGGCEPVVLSLVDAVPPRRIAFRWRRPGLGAGRPAPLVTFELVPAAGGTRIHLTATAEDGQDSTMR
jgi:uncharacterized protein YndB with AHSA1/START domain